MMPNANYRAGRALEYEVKKDFERRGYQVSRTAGSHGLFDLICLRADDVVLVQCKLCATQTKLEKFCKDFATSPPFQPYKFPAHQVMACRVKGRKDLTFQYV